LHVLATERRGLIAKELLFFMTIQFVHMNKINPINIAHVQHFGFHTADAERCLVFIFCPMNSGAKFNT